MTLGHLIKELQRQAEIHGMAIPVITADGAPIEQIRHTPMQYPAHTQLPAHAAIEIL